MIFFGWEIVMFSKKIATTRDITFFGPMNASSKNYYRKTMKNVEKDNLLRKEIYSDKS